MKHSPDPSFSKNNENQTATSEGNLFVCPTSFAQQRMWLLDELETGSAYNIRTALRLTGRINASALEKGLNEIVRRHEVLRTTFRAIDGSPMQVIAEKGTIVMPLIDLSRLTKAEREEEAGRLARDETMRRFDLAKGPLFSGVLIRLSEEEHILLLTMHHIVSDGWSMAILKRELMVFYEAFSNEDLSPLPELPVQYADFAHWQREWLQGEVLENQLSYWREKLEGVPVLQLFTDRPRPSVQTFAGAGQSIALSPRLSRALNDLSQRQGVTLLMTLLAAFQTLLFRYTGQEDIVVGTPIANRNWTEIERLIGFFVNSLALRTDLSGNPSFLELLGRVREVALGAFAHQDLPFEKLVEELNPERDMSRTPLFQIMFALQNMPAEELQLPGLTLSSFPIEIIKVRFDIEIHLWEKPEGLSGMVVYNTDLFEDATIARLMGHYETLLESIVTDPEQRISELPLLTAAERHQLLVEWNDTQADYPLDKCIHHLFEEQVKRSPEAVALMFEDRQMTYGELNDRSNQLAHHLQSLGVGPDVLVGICMERCLEMIVGLLGILKAGGAYVPLDPAYPKERLAFMLEDTQTPVLLSQRRLASRLPEHNAHLLCLDKDLKEIAQQSKENPACSVKSENLAYVIYTSGSTGRPKGVSMPHDSLSNLLVWQLQNFNNLKDAKTLQFTTLSFDVSFQEIFSTLCAGGKLVLISEDLRRDTSDLYRLLANASIERLFLPFVALQLLAEVAIDQGPVTLSLQEVITAGEQLQITPQIAELFKGLKECILVNQYGPTESHVVTAFVLKDSPDDWSLLPSIGRPISNSKIYLLDNNLQPVPVGVAGELYIGGACLARGYFNQPALTAEKFIPDPFNRQPGEALYKTGDLARYFPDGTIEFLGRRDFQVKLRGFRIELGEVEATLCQHPFVSEAVVVARDDRPGDKRLVAYVVASAAERVPATGDLRIFLQEKLPDYMIPSAFVFLDALPLTASGKVDRRALPAPDVVRPDLQEAFVAPRSQSEEMVAGIWSNVLGLERIGVYDSFFELGGHSLLVVQIISRIREVFEVELPVRSLFEVPTIAGLTELIETIRLTGLEPQPYRETTTSDFEEGKI